MEKEQFVFLDLMTTGGRPTIDKIFEIGIFYWNAAGQLTNWHKLINPELEVPASIQQLADITDTLLKQAVLFKHIAAELHTILENKIIIVNNATLKGGFLKQALKQAGFKWRGRFLCLTKLSHQLNIRPIKEYLSLYDALINAKQLSEFFITLFESIPLSQLTHVINKLTKQTSIPPYISADSLANIPNTSGVYKFYGEDNSLLYIGKSVCLQDRIKAHFSVASVNNREMRIAQQIRRIEWIETAGELGALLIEAKLVKELMPIYNRKLRRYKGLFTLVLETTPAGYHRLGIAVCQQNGQAELKQVYGLFRQKTEAEQTLRMLVKDYGFCAKLTGLEKGKGPCFYYQIKICKGACVGKENIVDYNLRLQQTLMSFLGKSWPYAGTIAIKETCNKRNINEYHIIDQWCYISTVSSINDIHRYTNSYNSSLFDLDIYMILVKNLASKDLITF